MNQHRGYLIREALKKTWCSPKQDKQWVFAPKRVSKRVGELGVTKLLGRDTRLPKDGVAYHVFRMGQIDPEFLNLVRQNPDWLIDEWVCFSDTMEKKNLEVTIYNEFGVNLLRGECYYRFTKDNCLFFIVPKLKGFPLDVETEQIYFRFYSYSSFSRLGGEGGKNFVVRTYRPMTVNEILVVEKEIAQLRLLPGHIRFYINGLLSNNFDYGNVSPGDYLECVVDPSVRKVLTWSMNTLFNFKSERDQLYKYLLHYPGDNNWLIDYVDYLDIYIVIERENNFPRGVYFNRNQRKNLRMITHKDYAIDSNMTMILRDRLSEVLGLASIPTDKTKVEVIVRNSGDPRFLGFEANRIKELYKLPANLVFSALLGRAATMPEWYCVNLEKSAYVDMLDRTWLDFDIDLVENGYGYNAISKILGDSPLKVTVEHPVPSLDVPPGCQKTGTAYEYDEDGLLLGWYPYFNQSVYHAKNMTTKMVEFLVGEGDITTDTVYGADNIPVDEDYDYKVYLCHIVNDKPDNKWEDITDTDYYKVEDGKVKWKKSQGDQWLAVRGDKKFLAYDYDININSGTLNFSILEKPEGDPFDEYQVMDIPFSQLEIWLFKDKEKGHKLIPGLDYYVKWPQVYVTNVLYLDQTTYKVNQRFHIRAHRLAENMEMDMHGEVGWVSHGMLSDNGRFNIRDDRVMQVNVGGRSLHPLDVKFVEDQPESKFFDPLNGFPYHLKPTIVPFTDFTNRSAYELRKPALEINKRVSEYLGSVFGDQSPEGPSIIGQRYPVVSPFLSHILHLLINKMLGIPEDRELSEMEVRVKMKPYEWLLDYDPLNGVNQPDVRYSFTIPHSSPTPFVLEFVDFRFFKRVCSIYGYPGLVINEYVTIRKY